MEPVQKFLLGYVAFVSCCFVNWPLATFLFFVVTCVVALLLNLVMERVIKMKTERQLAHSQVLANTSSYATDRPIPRRRKPAPPWLWLKLLVLVTVVLPVAYRVFHLLSN